MSLELTFEGRAIEELEFSPPERRQQVLLLRDKAMDSVVTLFKVQCTASRKFRVRPSLGIVTPGEAVAIHIHLNPQERVSFVCKLLVVCRTAVHPPPSVLDVDTEQLKTMWAAAEGQTDPSTLVFSETVNVHTRVASDVTATGSDDKPVIVPLSPPPPKLTTPQIADVVLLLMKSQSQKEENTLTTSEREQLMAAQEKYPSDWPCWEEYASRMRTLLRERNKRKVMTM